MASAGPQDAAVRLANALLLISSVAFALTGVGYLLIPATMLGVVGIAPNGTSDFLLRTEGVALLTAAGLAWAVRDGAPRRVSLALAALSLYYVLGSAVDLAAFTDDIVGPVCQCRAPRCAWCSGGFALWWQVEPLPGRNG
jgi:hypothetical protein